MALHVCLTISLFAPLLVVVAVGNNQHLPSLILKQAADQLMAAPFGKSEPQYQHGSNNARVELPSVEDLLIRRLQGELALRVEDNWMSLNDPQRWAIMQTKDPAMQILKSFEQIKTSSTELESAVDVEAVEKALNGLDLAGEARDEWVPYWESVRREVGKIAQFYNYFKGYIERSDISGDSLLDFATSVTTASPSLSSMLQSLHQTVQPTDSSKQLFPFLHKLLEEGEHLCGLNQSPHQLMFNLYNIIALTEIKGYAMLQFSYMMLKIYGKGNFTVEEERARQKFELQAKEKMESIKLVLPQMSRDYFMCDPQVQEEGETFLQVTRLLQGYIENEVDMNPSQECRSQCSSFNYAESTSCFKDLFCAKQPQCKGRIFDCEFFDARAWVCMADGGEGRRYDWVEYENGVLLGDKATCKNKIKVDSWWRYIFWHCSYCLCKCDEITDDSHRFWSLLPATADIAANKVVTGVRFTKIGKVIYPEIEQATALEEGGIDDSSREWVRPLEIRETDSNMLVANNSAVFTMSYEQRAVDLDSLVAPPGQVLTGVKLRRLGGHLNLEIQATPVKFREGKLLPDRSTWIGNDNTPATDKPRTFVPIIMPDVPTKLQGQNKVDSTTDQYLQFDATSAHKDVSQTTIPFIDAQPVSPKPSTWLSGAGLYHKGQVGFGGFLGLKVSSYDFSRHLIPGGAERPVLRYQFVRAEDVK